MARINDYTNTLSLIHGYEIRYRNPHFFRGPVECSFVYSDDPEIIKAYKGVGIEVWKYKQEKAKREDVIPVEPRPQDVGEIIQVEDTENKDEETTEDNIVVPDVWRDLSYWEKRTLAMKISPDEEVKNKVVAEEIIEAYLEKQKENEAT